MALTTAQLVAQYTNANLGKAPDAATQLLLEAYASQTQTGALTDGQALDRLVDLVDKTTSVAVATYQFFTGKTPSAAGLEFLVDSDDATGNTTDLNDAYYTKFATENRYINFAVNLGADPASEANASFKAAYGTLTFRQVVEVVYEKVIGTTAATAAGINVPAAIDFLARAENEAYLKAFVKQYAPGVDQDLGVKAALIGTIINAGLAANVGSYATATARLVADLADDGKLASADAVDLLVAYPPTVVTPPATSLTTGIDNLVGSAGANSYNAVVDGTTPANSTLNILDKVDGGAGIDTLTVGISGNGVVNGASGYTISNIEVINVSGTGTVNLDSTGFTGATNATVVQATTATVTAAGTTAIDISGATGAVTALGGSTVNVKVGTANADTIVGGAGADATGAITVTDTNVGTGDITIRGGSTVTVTAAGSTAGSTINVGRTEGSATTTAAASGAVSVTTTQSVGAAAAVTGAGVNVNGGTAVNVVQTAAGTKVATDTTGSTVTFGAVNVLGDKNTTSVSIDSASAVSARAFIQNVDESAAVTFADVANAGTVTVGGLTFTNSSGATLKAADVAKAFANLTAGATQGSTAASVGTYSGTFSAEYTSGAAASGAVTFTTAIGGATTDLAASASGTAPTVAITQGVDGQSGRLGIVSGAIDVDGQITGTDVLSTVSLKGFGTSTVKSDALATLNLTGSNSGVTVTNAAAKTLALNLDGVGTSTTNSNVDLGATYTTVDLKASTTSSDVNLTAAGVTKLNISGDKSVVLTGSSLAALDVLTVSGAAGVTFTTADAAVTSKIDASGTTGAVSASLVSTVTTYVGGSGTDTVTLLSSATPSKQIDGGAGTDTIALTADAAGTLTAATTFESFIAGFEKIQVGATAAATPITLDLANADDINYAISQGTNATGALTVNNFTSGGTLELTTAANDGGVTANLTDNKGTADTFNIVAKVGTGDLNFGTVTVAGVETVALTATDTSTTAGIQTATINVADTAMTSLTIAGNANATVTYTSTKVTSIDASAATGSVNVSTVQDGTAVLKGGAGDDTLISKGNLDTLTGGAGADIFDVTDATSNVNSYATITDFSAGDKIKFSGPDAFVAAKITLGDTAVFQDYANTAIKNSTVNDVSWFQFGGNTYIVQNAATVVTDTAFENGTDLIVKLTGLVDLSGASLSTDGTLQNG